MASEFAGLVALVTGAGSGIGRALALELAREGARVVVTDVDAATAAETAEAIRSAGGQATSLQLDVASRAAWEDAVARVERDWAPIDILCSNAGVNSCRLSLAEIPVDYLRWLFDVNVFSAVHGVQTLTPRMSARGRGWILFTGSMAGFASEPAFADYCASKHALLAIADSLRREVESLGVVVSYLCPAGVASNLLQTTMKHLPEAIGDQISGSVDQGKDVSRQAIEASGGMLSPETAAAIALEGLRKGQFILPTHAGSGGKAQRRHAELEAAIAALAGR